MNTATSEMLIESTVKPISRAPWIAASSGRHARLEMAHDVLHHHDRVVHHEAGGDREGHQREVVDAVADQVHEGEGADERHRHHHAGDRGGAPVAQEQEHHQDHQGHRDHQRVLDVRHRGADGHGLVEHRGQGHVGGQQRVQLGLRLADAVHRVDHVGAGLAEDDEQRGALAVGEADRAQVLDRVAHVGHVLQADRGPVAPGHQQRAVLRRVADLVAGADLPGPLRPVDLALRPVDVGAGQHRAHVLEPDAVARERVGIELHPHRGQRAAAHEHLAHPVELRQLLLEDRWRPCRRACPGARWRRSAPGS